MPRARANTILMAFVSLAVLASSIAPLATVQSEQPRNGYPDFALQAPPVNTAPGPEYASRTRLFQGIPGIERAANWAQCDEALL